MVHVLCPDPSRLGPHLFSFKDEGFQNHLPLYIIYVFI